MNDYFTVTESEEMYLVTMARIQEAAPQETIPLSELAERMNILPVSANQMVRKLQEGGLVKYTPYKGVKFTPHGKTQALQVLRHHRLWEVFLVDCLKISLKEADELADRMEHILPVGTVERLAAFLGNPSQSPSGRPIPKRDSMEIPAYLPLSQLKVGESGQLAEIRTSANTRNFLASQGLVPGTQVMILAKGHKGDILLQVSEDQSLHLSEQIAQEISLTNIMIGLGKDD